MKATFRIGPLLAEMRQLVPQGKTSPVDSLLALCPSERHGTWAWRQPQIDGTWPATALAPVDSNAVFPVTPPILRTGVIQLSDGLDD